jgi:hypothetical protein
MTDLEEQLRDALHSYAASVQPSTQRPDTRVVALRPSTRRPIARRPLLVVAAATIVLVGVMLARSPWQDASPAVPTVPLPTGHWTSAPPAPIAARRGASMVWTGKEFIVWGGNPNDFSAPFADGAAFDPRTSTWRPIAAHTFSEFRTRAAWTGDRMVVLDMGSGASYDPTTDRWTNLPSIGAVDNNSLHFNDLVAIDGTIIAYGFHQASVYAGPTGPGATVQAWTLQPGATTWATEGPTTIDDDGTYTVGHRKPLVATNDGFIAWGGTYGWRYDISGHWTRTPSFPLDPATESTAAWVDGRLVVVGYGLRGDELFTTTLNGSAWTPLRQLRIGVPGAYDIAAVGTRLVFLGIGRSSSEQADDTPIDLTVIDPVSARVGPMAGFPLQTVGGQALAWSGSQLFVWGGLKVHSATSTGPASSVASAAADPSDLTNTGALWTP